MQVIIAYLLVIIIWSTTPLAIQWSTDGVGALFAITGRMALGMILALLLCVMIRMRIPMHSAALKTYVASGMGGVFAMLFCYISVLYIPSGWLAVIFGLAPLITSIMAGLMLGKEHVTLQKIGSLLICLFGLSFIYYQGLDMGASVYLGFMYALLGVLGYSISLVAVKSINAHISPVATMTGTLVICGTTFTLACLYLAEGFPESVPARSAWSIIYLGTIGSVLGFVLFYYLLQKIDATRVALINLITPVSALLLGNLLNDEPLTGKIMIGGLFVLLGLLLFQFSAAIRTWISTIPGRINTTE